MPDKVHFIVNPHSGTAKRPIDEASIGRYLNHHNWSLQYTEYPGHARDIAKEQKSQSDVVVAVGGDGTVNEVASALIDSTTPLGIIPRGSGNGLSNYLGIPADLQKALGIIEKGHFREVDSMHMNEHLFVNMAGIGFDAHIAHLFDQYGARGLITYSKLVLKEFMSFPGVEVTLESNGRSRVENAFVLSFANSSQYGNNAHIAPDARIDDGEADVCIVHKFPLFSAPGMARRLFAGSIDQSRHYRSFRSSKIKLTSQYDLLAHVDGEPVNVGKEAEVTVTPRNLRILTPPPVESR